MERLKGKNVLITGASSGIGQAIAIRFAREGANVAINYRSGAEQAEATQALAKAARRNGSGREIIIQAETEISPLFDQQGRDGEPYEIARARICRPEYPRDAVGPGAVVTPINKAWIDNPKARGEVESHIPISASTPAPSGCAARN